MQTAIYYASDNRLRALENASFFYRYRLAATIFFAVGSARQIACAAGSVRSRSSRLQGAAAIDRGRHNRSGQDGVVGDNVRIDSRSWRKNYVLMEILDAKALRMFIAVARTGSIRSAAEHLNVAASVVSRQIADTEKNVGLPLFERSSRGVELTDAGTLVLEHAQRVIEDSGLLSEQLDQLRSVQQARIRICCGEGFLGDMIEHGLRTFVNIYPTVAFSLTLGSTDDVLDNVANGDTDIGIAYHPVIDTRVRSLAISRQPLCLVAPMGHPLLEREAVTLSDCLARGRYALLSEGHGVTQLVGRVAADHGVAVAPLVETPSIDVLRRFVMAGLGMTFLPRFAVATELSRSALGVVELSDPLLSQASAHLLVKSRRRLPASVERLASHLAGELTAFNV